MTTEFDDAGEQTPVNGFWGRPLDGAPSGDAEGKDDSREDAQEEALEEGVPPWLGLSHTVDATGPAPMGEAPASSSDATGQLPRIRERLSVLPPQADEPVLDYASVPEHVAGTTPEPEPRWFEADAPESAAPEVEPATEPAGAVEPADAGPDEFAWEDELSWEDDDFANAETAVAPTTPTLDEPGEPAASDAPDEPDDSDRYIDVDMGYASGASLYATGDTGYLVGSSAYDDADEVPAGGTHMRLRIVAVVVSVVAALIAVYVLGVRRFSNRMLPNTQINGLPVAGMTVEEAVAALEDETANYSCAITVGDFSQSVAGADVSLERDEQNMAELAHGAQSAYLWPIRLIVGQNLLVDPGTTLDEEALNGLVETAVSEYNQQTLPTANATIEYDEEAGLFEVAGTTSGTAVDAEQLEGVVLADMQAFAPVSTPAPETVTHEATVHDIPSFEDTAQNANRTRTSDVSILVNGEPVITSEAAQNAEWTSVGEGPSVQVDEEAVRLWAEYYVADAVFHTDDWSNYFLDVDAFVEGFCDRLAHGNVEGYEAPTYDELRTEGESREKAYAKGGWDSTKGRYIDVDLDSQFARLFDEKGEVIWESAFVSGEVYAGRSTVEGTFQIYAMETNTVLVGMDYDGNGEPDYESFVNYWMPFYGGYGLHDATWRSNFGGEYYYYYGSHGCVNLPYSKAEELFGITFIGETVFVHW